jgi:acyl-coenzyme A thioesterase PaaI-like protein
VDESTPAQRERRAAMERLAIAARAFGDAMVETDVPPTEVDAVTAVLDGLTERLRCATHDGPYSGLTLLPVDYMVPEDPMPLNPIIGACSPIRPDVEIRIVDGEVQGRACFTKRFVGPPGCTHGGISAMLADQIVAITPMAIGARPITKSLQIRYRRPLPLHEELTLWGVCEPEGDNYRARFEIRVGDTVAVEGTAEISTYDKLRRPS